MKDKLQRIIILQASKKHNLVKQAQNAHVQHLLKIWLIHWHCACTLNGCAITAKHATDLIKVETVSSTLKKIYCYFYKQLQGKIVLEILNYQT